jgi:aerobic C4-dicarboxylate transport protein
MATCTALTNVVGNVVATFYIAKWEGAFDTQKWQAIQAEMEAGPVALAEAEPAKSLPRQTSH